MVSKHRRFHGQIPVWLCGIALGSAIACSGDAEPAGVAKPVSQQAHPESAKEKKAKSDRPGKQRQPTAAIGYPDDLPAYPGAKVVIAEKAKTGSGASFMLESSDSLTDAVAQMSSLLEKDGWFVQSTEKDGAYFIFADKGSRNLAVQVMSKDESTFLNLLDLDLK